MMGTPVPASSGYLAPSNAREALQSAYQTWWKRLFAHQSTLMRLPCSSSNQNAGSSVYQYHTAKVVKFADEIDLPLATIQEYSRPQETVHDDGQANAKPKRLKRRVSYQRAEF
jgi:hypothetical protein